MNNCCTALIFFYHPLQGYSLLRTRPPQPACRASGDFLPLRHCSVCAFSSTDTLPTSTPQQQWDLPLWPRCRPLWISGCTCLLWWFRPRSGAWSDTSPSPRTPTHPSCLLPGPFTPPLQMIQANKQTAGWRAVYFMQGGAQNHVQGPSNRALIIIPARRANWEFTINKQKSLLATKLFPGG